MTDIVILISMEEDQINREFDMLRSKDMTVLRSKDATCKTLKHTEVLVMEKIVSHVLKIGF